MTNKKKSVTAIIVAAGNGTRMKKKTPKQFLELKNKPILVYTLETFQKTDIIDKIVLVCQESFILYCHELAAKYSLNKIKKIIPGGCKRQVSVGNGLKFVDTDIVCIHDGVRPFVNQNLIKNIIEECEENDGCICAIKPKDTVKFYNNHVIKTLDRENIYLAQTPQAFKTNILKSCYIKSQKENIYFTDESSLMEYYNHKIKIIDGDYLNIKITTPEDLFFANAYLDLQKSI